MVHLLVLQQFPQVVKRATGAAPNVVGTYAFEDGNRSFKLRYLGNNNDVSARGEVG